MGTTTHNETAPLNKLRAEVRGQLNWLPFLAAKYATPLDLTRTAAALRAFDEAVLAEEAVLEGPLEGKACVDALVAASRHVEACAVAVGEAFALDTADRNPLSTARSLRPNGWLRDLVARATSGACEVAS